MRIIRRVIVIAMLIVAGLTLCNCASQRKHHKAIPCPCEKHNKR
jgi:hypothetical protein